MIWLWLALAAFVATGAGGLIGAALLGSARDDPRSRWNPVPLLVVVGIGTLIGIAMAVHFVMWLRGWK